MADSLVSQHFKAIDDLKHHLADAFDVEFYRRGHALHARPNTSAKTLRRWIEQRVAPESVAYYGDKGIVGIVDHVAVGLDTSGPNTELRIMLDTPNDATQRLARDWIIAWGIKNNSARIDAWRQSLAS